jgi:hypothetical protein
MTAVSGMAGQCRPYRYPKRWGVKRRVYSELAEGIRSDFLGQIRLNASLVLA